MDDLISRQSVLNVFLYFDESKRLDMIKKLPSAEPDFNEWCTDCKEYDQERHCYPRYNRVIREALDAVEKPKTGKWIETDDGWDGTYYVCSICGCLWTLIDGDPEDNGMNYCPHCGADMRTSE